MWEFIVVKQRFPQRRLQNKSNQKKQILLIQMISMFIYDTCLKRKAPKPTKGSPNSIQEDPSLAKSHLLIINCPLSILIILALFIILVNLKVGIMYIIVELVLYHLQQHYKVTTQVLELYPNQQKQNWGKCFTLGIIFYIFFPKKDSPISYFIRTIHPNSIA